MREEWKGVANNILEKWLTVTAEEAEYDRGLTAISALFALIDMVNAFDDAFTAAKRKKCCGFQRFGDFAVRLLYIDGKPSTLAKPRPEQFTEIAVDEYRDNPTPCRMPSSAHLQETRTNLFMVGDVKAEYLRLLTGGPSISLEEIPQLR